MRMETDRDVSSLRIKLRLGRRFLNMTVRLTSSSRVAAICPELFACLSFANGAQPKLDMIKSALVVCLALLFVCGGVLAQAQYRGGIVYGAKAAFDIAAPDG
jgi:hypothetical protein